MDQREFLEVLAKRLEERFGRGMFVFEVKWSKESSYMCVSRVVSGARVWVDVIGDRLYLSDLQCLYNSESHDLRDPSVDPVGVVVEFLLEREKEGVTVETRGTRREC